MLTKKSTPTPASTPHTPHSSARFKVYDIRQFVNVHNLRMGQQSATIRLKTLLQPIDFAVERRVYDIDAQQSAFVDEHLYHHQHGTDWRLRRQYLYEARVQQLKNQCRHHNDHINTSIQHQIQIPESAIGVICLSKENVTGGMVSASSEPFSRHACKALDLPPGFMAVHIQQMTTFELLDSHSPGSATILWLIERNANANANANA